ncbi:hypothetical protein SAMN05446935_9912 [Burkholderia sp. YR290]|nr:hypothetical protein SAMN05446935_9912 [Burkholderia sp. YR290]
MTLCLLPLNKPYPYTLLHDSCEVVGADGRLSAIRGSVSNDRSCRLGEVANGRFMALHFAKSGFDRLTALEQVV